MGAKVYTIINRKGGVGKTTTTYNLSAALAMGGKTVLMVDMDEQCSLTEQCGIYPGINNEQFGDNTTAKLFVKGIDPTLCCFTIDALEQVKTKDGKSTALPLYIISSTPDLAVTKAELYSDQSGMDAFIENIGKLRNYFDFIFFDCSPLQDNMTVSTLLAADEVIIPVKPERTSFNVQKIVADVADVKVELAGKRSNPDLKIAGTIATLYRSRVSEHKAYTQMLADAGNLLGIIPEAAIVVKEVAKGLPVVIAHPTATAAKEYIRIAQTLA